MEERLTGHFVTAKAGHDAGTLYVVIAEDAEFIYVSDGKARSLEKPKKKNRKHVQPWRAVVPEELRARLCDGKEKVFDHEIKYAIKQQSLTDKGQTGKEEL